MSRPPTVGDGADAFTVSTLGATVQDTRNKLNAQQQAVDRADAAGKRSTRISIAILLAGLALSISALASVRARGLNPIDAVAGCMLTVALLTAASVFLI
jgi:hypothetical protein